MMKKTDPLQLRCLALTGSFETGHLPPYCFSALAGDFDGQGLSFSALQWNLGQRTLQPLLGRMIAQRPEVMTRCFGELGLALQGMLDESVAVQLAWARSIQGPNHHVTGDWVTAFASLGATAEWQIVARESAAGYFDRAKFHASQFKLTSDRAIALLFDCAIQNGGVPSLALHHVLDIQLPDWGEPELLRTIAGAVADSVNPKYRPDVLARKMTVANGNGIVHGIHYDLEEFGL
jgi:hypothetical protein